MIANQQRRSSIHRRYIERNRNMPAIARPNSRPAGLVPHLVAICTTLRVTPRVERLRCHCELFHRHIRRQQRVETALETEEIPFMGCMKRHNLAESMHSGICSASCPNPDGFVEKTGQDCFKPALECHRVQLQLPTVIVGAVVFQDEFILHGPASYRRRVCVGNALWPGW